MTQLKSIAYELKGITVAYDVAQRQAFVGKNRQGKTTILDAIELATRGKHHVGDTASTIIELYGPDAPRIMAHARGICATGKWQAKYVRELDGQKPGQPEWRTRGLSASFLARVLPDLSNALKGDRLAREALFARFAPAKVASPKGLDAEQRKTWKLALAVLPKDIDAGERLARMASGFRGTKNRLGREIGALQRSIEAVRDRVDDGAGVEEIPALERRLAALDEMDVGPSVLAGLREAFAKADTQAVDLSRRIARAEKVMKGGACPTCKRPADEDLIRRASIAVPKRMQERVGLVAEALAIKKRITDLEAHVVERAEIESELATLRESSGDARSIDAESSRLRDLQTEQGIAKFLEVAATKSMTSMLGKIQVDAEAAVNAGMPPGFIAELTFDTKRCAWAVRDERGIARRKTGSGSELAALAIGLHVAWGARLLFLDDVDISLITCESLTGLCDTLSKAIKRGDIDQAILIVDPDREHRLPGDWKRTVIG